MHSWRVLILPYLEQKVVYDKYDFTVPWDHPNNARLADSIPSLYRSPGIDEGHETNYLAVIGPDTAFDSRPETHSDLIRGDSETLMIVENADRRIHWMQPEDMPLEEAASGIGKPGGITSEYTEPAGVTVGGHVLKLDAELSQVDLRGLLTVPSESETTVPPSGAVEIEDGRLRTRR